MSRETVSRTKTLEKVQRGLLVDDGRTVPDSKWREYQLDLVRRTCQVACPTCGQKAGELCINDSGMAKGRLKAMETHYARKDAARKAGYIGRKVGIKERFGIGT